MIGEDRNNQLSIKPENIAKFNQLIEKYLKYVIVSGNELYAPTKKNITRILAQDNGYSLLLESHKASFNEMYRLMEFMRRAAGRKFPQEMMGLMTLILNLPDTEFSGMYKMVEKSQKYHQTAITVGEKLVKEKKKKLKKSSPKKKSDKKKPEALPPDIMDGLKKLVEPVEKEDTPEAEPFKEVHEIQPDFQQQLAPEEEEEQEKVFSCGACQKPVTESAVKCPHCGSKFE